MHIPARILREQVMDVDRTLRQLTEREREREERILKDAQYLIARFGPSAITFTNLAIAIKVAPSTMRKHFADLDALLGDLMRRHLRNIVKAIGAVPVNTPDRRRAMRAAYVEATRILGAPTEPHLILITYLNYLPEDERRVVIGLRDEIASLLDGAHGNATLQILDCPHYDIAQIEDMITAAKARRAQPPAPAPEDTPSPTEKTPLAPAAKPASPWDGEIIDDLSALSGVRFPGGGLFNDAPRGPPDQETDQIRHVPDAVLAA